MQTSKDLTTSKKCSRKNLSRDIRRRVVELEKICEVKNLPTSLDVDSFIQARYAEIEHFEKEIGEDARRQRSKYKTYFPNSSKENAS